MLFWFLTKYYCVIIIHSFKRWQNKEFQWYDNSLLFIRSTVIFINSDMVIFTYNKYVMCNCNHRLCKFYNSNLYIYISWMRVCLFYTLCKHICKLFVYLNVKQSLIKIPLKVFISFKKLFWTYRSVRMRIFQFIRALYVHIHYT